MAVSAEQKEKMEQLQNELNTSFNEYIMKEFQLKLDFQKANAGVLEKRDEMFFSLSDDDQKDMITEALSNFPEMLTMLPITEIEGEECYDCDFIKFIRAEYLEGQRVKVTVELFENNYIEQTHLERTFGFVNKEDNAMTLTYKPGVEIVPFFSYFEGDSEGLEIFDLFHEFYTNLVFYSFNGGEDAEKMQ